MLNKVEGTVPEYLALDCETGGTTPWKHSLLSLYMAVLDKNLDIIDELYLKIKPNNGVFRVEGAALNVNKIDLVQHEKVALTEDEANEKTLKFLATYGRKKPLTPIGHNVNFDLDFMEEHLKYDFSEFISYRYLDTASIIQFLRWTGHIPPHVTSLHKAAKEFGIPDTNAHDPKADIFTTVRVLNKLRVKAGLVGSCRDE